MKILIVSDTHRKMVNLEQVIEMEKPIDMLIHCGDMELPDERLRSLVKCPVAVVSGNNDYFYDYAKELIVPVGPYKAFVAHGHNYGVTLSPEYIAKEGRARGVDFVFFGHTHVPYCEKKHDVQLINPGSISYPRQQGRVPTYAVLKLDGEDYNCEIKEFETSF